jgi:hypothetical protein
MEPMNCNTRWYSWLVFLALMVMTGVASATAEKHVRFGMVVSAAASSCLPNASATAQLVQSENVEDLYILATGLPPNTTFDLFIIQVPKTPFGLAWYQGDLQSDDQGIAVQHLRGIFSIETFTVAPGAASAPTVFGGPFPDAMTNPPFNPIQMYHVGIWFDSPDDAQKAGCPNTVTPFNGSHNAGIQVLNTSNYPDNAGPLSLLPAD